MCIFAYLPLIFLDSANIAYITGVIVGVLALSMVISLHWGHRERAKRISLVAAIQFAIGWGIMTPALRSFGQFSAGLAVMGWSAATILVVCVMAPRYSFYSIW